MELEWNYIVLEKKDMKGVESGAVHWENFGIFFVNSL